VTSDPALWLAQVQSFLSLGFLAVFAALSLGLAWLLTWFRLRSLRRRAHAGWLAAYRFWVRVFALALTLAFAAGVAALIQLPGLWPGLPERISAVGSPLLALALVGVFCVKVCFLGAMLFAERRLSASVHAFVVGMVAVGITLTMACLLLLGSWTQTPAGAVLQNGQFQVQDWAQALGNPSMPWYLGLTLAGSLLGAACVVLAVTAWQGAGRAANPPERLAFRTSLAVALFSALALAALLPGLGRVTAVHQPAKAAAIAAVWQSSPAPDLTLLAWPDAGQARNRAAWTLPHAGGLWLGTDAQGRARGLDQFAGMHPPVALVFFSVRGAWVVGALTLLTLLYMSVRRWRTAPDGLSRRERACLIWLGSAGAWLLLFGVATLVFGTWPFAVQDAITLGEVLTDAPVGALIASLAASIVVYAVLLVAFVGMLRHAARYGVIPVTRHRGGA